MMILTRRLAFAALLCVLFFPALAKTAEIPSTDTIVLSGKIYTVNAAQLMAKALAILDGKIIAVGSSKEIGRYRGPKTQVIDAGGRLVLPGFTDCHTHILSGALSLGQVQVDGTTSVPQIQERVRKYVYAHPGKGWVLGRGWNFAAFGATALSNKKDIDAIVPDRPVFLEGYDGQTYWAKSDALEIAGVTKATPDPRNGTIVRDPQTGEATGALKEAAAGVVERAVPKSTRAEMLVALRQGSAEANRVGVVRAHSAGGDFAHFDLYDALNRTGNLTVRMYNAYFLDPPELTSNEIKAIEDARKRYTSEFLPGGAVKMMLDGVVESHTAAMLQPYSDDAHLIGDGPLENGKVADIIVLDQNLFEIDPIKISQTEVLLTLVGGKTVYQAPNWKAAAERRSEEAVR